MPHKKYPPAFSYLYRPNLSSISHRNSQLSSFKNSKKSFLSSIKRSKIKEHSNKSAEKCFSTLITSEKPFKSTLLNHNNASKTYSKSESFAAFSSHCISIIIHLFRLNLSKISKMTKIYSRGSYYHTANQSPNPSSKYSTKIKSL